MASLNHLRPLLCIVCWRPAQYELVDAQQNPCGYYCASCGRRALDLLRALEVLGAGSVGYVARTIEQAAEHSG